MVLVYGKKSAWGSRNSKRASSGSWGREIEAGFGRMIRLVGVKLRTYFREFMTLLLPRIWKPFFEENGDRRWFVNVNRNLNDWEIEEYEALLLLLSTIQLNSVSNYLVWTLGKPGEFTVTSYYKFLTRRDRVETVNFPTNQVWKVKAPPRIAFSQGKQLENAY